MTVAITMEELLAWNNETSEYWRAYLESFPGLLDTKFGSKGAAVANVRDFVALIWSTELRWAENLAGKPVTQPDRIPAGSLGPLYEMHQSASILFKELLEDSRQDWDAPYMTDANRLSSEQRMFSRRKALVHALFLSYRRWVELSMRFPESDSPAEALLRSSAMK